MNDAIGSSTVPTIRKSTLFPLSSDHFLYGFTQFFRVFTHQNVGSDGYCFLMFGVIIERDTRYAVEGCLLSDVAGIGDYTLRMCREPSEFEVTQRISD